jgi:hypothetical protein
MEVSRLPAALAYKLIRRGCSPADLATLAMLWPRGSHNGRLGGLRRVEERDAPFSGEPSTYDLHAARTRQERELRVQVRKHGDEAMRAEPKVAVGGSDTLSTEPFERS